MLLTHLFWGDWKTPACRFPFPLLPEPAPDGLFDGSPPVAEGSAFREIMQGFQFVEDEGNGQKTGSYPSLADLIDQVIAQDGEAEASGPHRMPSDFPAQGTPAPLVDAESFTSEAPLGEARFAQQATTEVPSVSSERTPEPPTSTREFLAETGTSFRENATRPESSTRLEQSEQFVQSDRTIPTDRPIQGEVQRGTADESSTPSEQPFESTTRSNEPPTPVRQDPPQTAIPANHIEGPVQTQPVSTVDVTDAPATASQTDAVEDAKVTQQIVRGARFLNRSNLAQITIRMDPPELGEVTVELATREQTVTGEIRVESRTVQEIVQRNLAELKDSLNGQGIQIDKIEVSVDAGGRSAVDREGENLLRERTGREDAARRDRNQNPDFEESPSEEYGYRNRTQDGRVDFVA